MEQAGPRRPGSRAPQAATPARQHVRVAGRASPACANLPPSRPAPHQRTHPAWAARRPWAAPAPCRCAQRAAPAAAGRPTAPRRWPPASPRPSCGAVDKRVQERRQSGLAECTRLRRLWLRLACDRSTPQVSPTWPHLTGSMRPSRERVPSGKMCTHSPAARRCRASRMPNWSRPAPRSTGSTCGGAGGGWPGLSGHVKEGGLALGSRALQAGPQTAQAHPPPRSTTARGTATPAPPPP